MGYRSMAPSLPPVIRTVCPCGGLPSCTPAQGLRKTAKNAMAANNPDRTLDQRTLRGVASRPSSGEADR